MVKVLMATLIKNLTILLKSVMNKKKVIKIKKMKKLTF